MRSTPMCGPILRGGGRGAGCRPIRCGRSPSPVIKPESMKSVSVASRPDGEREMTNQAVADLISRSNRLGSDPKNTNYAGGNTSAKGTETDPVTGEPVELLWV